ncbi:MAG: hypothetical protein JXK05_04030 [Campylobacterales bacterium]|nr:hypothetical protein [Campylobacterales bacterium]
MSKAEMTTMVALITVMSGGKKIDPLSEHNTFECSAEEAQKLIRLGAAKRVDEVRHAKAPLSEMKVDELRALASQRGVELPEGVTKKADIIALLSAADEE